MICARMLVSFLTFLFACIAPIVLDISRDMVKQLLMSIVLGKYLMNLYGAKAFSERVLSLKMNIGKLGLN